MSTSRREHCSCSLHTSSRDRALPPILACGVNEQAGFIDTLEPHSCTCQEQEHELLGELDSLIGCTCSICISKAASVAVLAAACSPAVVAWTLQYRSGIVTDKSTLPGRLCTTSALQSEPAALLGCQALQWASAYLNRPGWAGRPDGRRHLPSYSVTGALMSQ